MKIYNEITLEWNEDTKRYDNVVSEDSFEYDGDIAYAQQYMPPTMRGLSPQQTPYARTRAESTGRIRAKQRDTWDEIMNAAREQEEEQSKAGLFSSLFGLGGSLLMNYLVPGAGLLTKFLGQGGKYALGSLLGKGLHAKLYQPKKFEPKTEWGKDKFKQLEERGETFKSGLGESAAGSFAQNLLFSFLKPELFSQLPTRGTGPTSPTNPKFANMPSLDKQWSGAGFQEQLRDAGIQMPNPFHRGLGYDALQKLTEVVKPGGAPIELPFNFEDELEFPSDKELWQ